MDAIYGDFGRYVFELALRSFIDVDLVNVFYYSLDYIFNELGYNSNYFGEYDTNSFIRDPHGFKKIERIGKKYQWIAMYNILARISDNHLVERAWGWNDKNGENYKGPWNSYIRDFDPTLNTRYGDNLSIPILKRPEYDHKEFLSFEASKDEIYNWTINESKVFTDYPNRLVLIDADGNEWVSLYHYNKVSIQPKNTGDRTFGAINNSQSIWTISTAHIKKDVPNTKEFLTILEENFVSMSNKISNCYSLFSREYAWSPGYMDVFRSMATYEESDFTGIVPAGINFIWESEFDSSQDEASSFVIPTGEILNTLKLEIKKYDGYYYFQNDLIALI